MSDDHNGQTSGDSNATDDEEPLLSNETSPNNIPEAPDHNAISTDTHSFSSLILYFMALHFLLAFNELILVAPLIRLFEHSLCLSHYTVHDPSVIGAGDSVPEFLCKIAEIQTPLATIRGWKSMFDTVPVLLIGIPFGRLGDRFGRKKLLALCLVGVAGSYCEIFVVCAFPRVFPLQLVWLSSVVLFCGGGLFSAVALMWAMASEYVPSERRSYSFYYIFSAFYIAELIGSSIAAATTDISPWIPCGLSMVSIFAGLTLLWTLPQREKSSQSVPSASASQDLSEPNEESTHLLSDVVYHQESLVTGIGKALSNRNILLAIPVFLTGSLRHTILSVLIQYASNRFSIRISIGALFYTETAIVNIILFLLLVPSLSSYVRNKCNVGAQSIDLFLVRTCVSLLCLGCLFIGLSQSAHILPIGVFVFAAGFGIRVSTLSLVSYWISDDSKATLYAAIAVIENLGHAIGDPSLQQIFGATMRLGFPPFCQALPFFVAVGLYLLAGLSTVLITID